MSDPRTPKLADVIRAAVDSALSDFRVALPGRVQSFDASKQAADVQPILKQTYVDEEGQEQAVAFPVVRNVPVVFPGAGGFRITFPLQAGDDVLLIFSDLGLDKYLSNGGALVDPVSLHEHHLADAIAIPGLHPFSSPWSGSSDSNMTLGADGGPQIHLKAGAICLGDEAATEPAVLGQALVTAIANLATAIAGALTTMGAVPASPMPGSLAVTAGTTITGAVTAFNTAAAQALSTIVKVK